jgi:hypothetical protein
MVAGTPLTLRIGFIAGFFGVGLQTATTALSTFPRPHPGSPNTSTR